ARATEPELHRTILVIPSHNASREPVVNLLGLTHPLPIPVRERRALHSLRMSPRITTVVVTSRQTLEEQAGRRLRVLAGSNITPPPRTVAPHHLLLLHPDALAVRADRIVGKVQGPRHLRVGVHGEVRLHEPDRQSDDDAALRDPHIAADTNDDPGDVILRPGAHSPSSSFRYFAS